MKRADENHQGHTFTVALSFIECKRKPLVSVAISYSDPFLASVNKKLFLYTKFLDQRRALQIGNHLFPRTTPKRWHINCGSFYHTAILDEGYVGLRNKKVYGNKLLESCMYGRRKCLCLYYKLPLHKIFLVLVVVVPTPPWAILLAMIIMRTAIHGLLWVWCPAWWPAGRAAGASVTKQLSHSMIKDFPAFIEVFTFSRQKNSLKHFMRKFSNIN